MGIAGSPLPVLIGAVCYEAGHSDFQHPGRRRQMRKACTISASEEAGESDHSGLQPMRTVAKVPLPGVSDLRAVSALVLLGDKRRSIHKAVEPGFCQFHGEGDKMDLPVQWAGTYLSVDAQALYVDIAVEDALGKQLDLRDRAKLFQNEVVSRKYYVPGS